MENLFSVFFSVFFQVVKRMRATHLVFSCYFFYFVFLLSISLSLPSYFLFSSTSIRNDSATQYLCKNNFAFSALPDSFFFLRRLSLLHPTLLTDGAAAQTMLDSLRYTYAYIVERRRKEEKSNSYHHSLMSRGKKENGNSTSDVEKEKKRKKSERRLGRVLKWTHFFFFLVFFFLYQVNRILIDLAHDQYSFVS